MPQAPEDLRCPRDPALWLSEDPRCPHPAPGIVGAGGGRADEGAAVGGQVRQGGGLLRASWSAATAPLSASADSGHPDFPPGTGIPPGISKA